MLPRFLPDGTDLADPISAQPSRYTIPPKRKKRGLVKCRMQARRHAPASRFASQTQAYRAAELSGKFPPSLPFPPCVSQAEQKKGEKNTVFEKQGNGPSEWRMWRQPGIVIVIVRLFAAVCQSRNPITALSSVFSAQPTSSHTLSLSILTRFCPPPIIRLDSSRLSPTSSP